jgi:hypothetical protein
MPNELETSGVSLREFLCAKITALDTKIELHLQLSRVALDKAESQMNERLERMNEFRDSLRDQAERFVTKSEWASQHKVLLEDIRTLRESRERLEGKASASSVYVAYGISLIGIVLGVAALVMR